MAAFIKSVHIRNFRSIHSLDTDVALLAMFVGKNDCGKSNILRALNLFFNDETNPGAAFSFVEDYNLFAPERVRKAKEILVRVEIELPESYRRTNGDVIIWTKRWREDGLWSSEDEYYGQRITRNSRGREVRKDVDIPERSNVRGLLRKIEFEYVPAIKDAAYFDDLRGRLYGVISEVAAQTLHESSSAFEQSIGSHLDDLTTNITDALGFDTRLALPRDLSHIFERLDFLSGVKSVSLDNRGDGIKARHIPLILRFMAEKKASLSRQGGSPISSIWAYEEPENNLEIGSAVQLADEFHALTESPTVQILLTTHSPAFYDLGRREEAVTLSFVTRTSDIVGTVTETDTTGIDESLGTLAMLAPRISELVGEIREQEAIRAESARLATESRHRIFVEGKSDQIILRRALELFFPAAVGAVSFETKNGAGHKYVIDMLNSWRSHHKHHPSLPKAAGIVDGDANQEMNVFNNQEGNVKSAKCFEYPKPSPVRKALGEGFSIYASLETLYPQEVWAEALDSGHLCDRDWPKICSKKLTKQIFDGETTFVEALDDTWSYLVIHDFARDHKIPTAKRLCGLSDEKCRKTLANFEPFVEKILKFVGVST